VEASSHAAPSGLARGTTRSTAPVPCGQEQLDDMRFSPFLRYALTSLALAALLTSCVEPARRSNINDTLSRVSFEAPPLQPGEAPPAGSVGEQAAPEPPLQPQIFPGRATGRPGRGTAGVQRSAEGVQLNFDGAEIREVAKVILGDILGRTYTINPDVQGQVTLSSSAPLAERDLLAVLETVLRSNGASLVDTGAGTFQIMPVDAAIGRSEVVPIGGRPVPVRPGYGLTIVPLRNISATAAAQFIQPLVASPEDIRIDPGRNAILFSGTSTERQNVVDTLADLDVDWMAGKSIGLFPLQRTTAEAIIPELQAIFAPFDPTGAEPSLMRFLPIARLNAVLAIGSDPDQIREVSRWVTRLDHGEVVGTQFYVYYLKHRSADDIAKLLNETFGGAAGAPSEPGPSLASATAGLGDTTQPGGVPPGEAPIGGEAGGFVPEGVPAPGAPPPAEPSTASGPVKIVSSRANNALLIRATPTIYEQIEATLLRLDTAPWQVLIEATIAEVTLNDELRYGVQFFLQNGAVKIGFTNSTENTQPALNLPGFNFIFTPGSSNLTIDALSRITDVKVLSSPSVVVLDNSEAVLTVGQEVPVQTRTAQAVTDPEAPLVSSIEYRDTGVILQVRPRINSNQAVSLEIAQEVSRVDQPGGTTTTNLTPTITQRKITSRVSVQNGQTVVLGGLIQESEARGRDRVPVLGEIPVLGSLFGSTSNINIRTELIVFITPRVVRNPEDARDVSEELRSRLRSLSPTQVTPLMPNVMPPAAEAPRAPGPGPEPRLLPQPLIPQRAPYRPAPVG
jgi:general secretion pathway protein D